MHGLSLFTEPVYITWHSASFGWLEACRLWVVTWLSPVRFHGGTHPSAGLESNCQKHTVDSSQADKRNSWYLWNLNCVVTKSFKSVFQNKKKSNQLFELLPAKGWAPHICLDIVRALVSDHNGYFAQGSLICHTKKKKQENHNFEKLIKK